MTSENRRDRFLYARAQLAATIRANDDGDNDDPAVCVDLTLARDLLHGVPPVHEPHESAVRFAARYVPFLRPVLDPPSSSLAYRGITVLPHPDGGVTLFATNGHVMLIAHDRTGEVTAGGCRVELSTAAMDACVPPEPFELWFEGEKEEVGTVPPYMMPGEVISLGVSMLIMPAEQPPDLDDPCNGGALYTRRIETNVWRGGDRRMATVLEQHHIKVALRIDAPLSQPCAVTSITQTVVAQAMAAADPDLQKLVWDSRISEHQVTYIPRQRDDLLISFATARDPRESPQIPGWALRALEAS